MHVHNTLSQTDRPWSFPLFRMSMCLNESSFKNWRICQNSPCEACSYVSKNWKKTSRICAKKEKKLLSFSLIGLRSEYMNAEIHTEMSDMPQQNKRSCTIFLQHTLTCAIQAMRASLMSPSTCVPRKRLKKHGPRHEVISSRPGLTQTLAWFIPA
jgi:hypothetical protein